MKWRILRPWRTARKVATHKRGSGAWSMRFPDWSGLTGAGTVDEISHESGSFEFSGMRKARCLPEDPGHPFEVVPTLCHSCGLTEPSRRYHV
jgi:hypothetical protein